MFRTKNREVDETAPLIYVHFITRVTWFFLKIQLLCNWVGFVNKSNNQFSIWIMRHIFFTNIIDLRGAQGNPTTTAAVLLFELNSWDLSISVLRVGKNSIIILIFQKEHLRCDKTASLLIVCVMTRMQRETIS